MKTKNKKIKNIIKTYHIPTIFLILALYLLLCLISYLILKKEDGGASFWDIVIFNFLAVEGTDYMYVDNPWTRIAGIFVLILGMVGLSTITGYISSAFVARRLNMEQGVKKMQKLKNHVIVCGWKNDVRILLKEILHKNKDY